MDAVVSYLCLVSVSVLSTATRLDPNGVAQLCFIEVASSSLRLLSSIVLMCRGANLEGSFSLSVLTLSMSLRTVILRFGSKVAFFALTCDFIFGFRIAHFWQLVRCLLRSPCCRHAFELGCFTGFGTFVAPLGGESW